MILYYSPPLWYYFNHKGGEFLITEERKKEAKMERMDGSSETGWGTLRDFEKGKPGVAPEDGLAYGTVSERSAGQIWAVQWEESICDEREQPFLFNEVEPEQDPKAEEPTIEDVIL